MSRLPWIVFGFAPSRTRTVRRPSLLQAPTVCRAEFDCKSRPTITVRLLTEGSRQAKFQVAQLVASQGKAGEVVPLDKDPWRRRTTERTRQVRRFRQGCRFGDEGDAGDPCDMLPDRGKARGRCRWLSGARGPVHDVRRGPRSYSGATKAPSSQRVYG